jgi:hypothetical protein
MNEESGTGGFIRERRAGMIAIAAAMPVALLLWLAIAYLVPPLAGMDSLGDRMLFTLKCCCLTVLFCLVTGVEAVAHERLSSPAFDPLSGFETRRLRVNQRYLQNTLEQILVFAAGLSGPQPIPRMARQCGLCSRPPLFGYWPASLFGSAIIGAPQCGVWVRRGWRLA